MATKGYNLEQTGEQVQAALNKAINLGPATEEADGLMTSTDKASLEHLNSVIDTKVDKVTGKGLSTNDFTNEDKSKLDTAYQVPSTGIPAADMSSGVQTSLGKANSAVQPADLVPITEKIPAQASAQNQLADKAFVNSSISTASADFKGTYDSLAELQAVTADKNDYGYVVSTDEAGNTVYSRYKYNGSSWVFEYDLNNSSFTAAEWAAIQSGITAPLVQKLGALPTNADLQSALSGKQATLVSGTNIKTVDGQSILGSGNLSVSDPNAVKVTAQTWTDAQKTQARTNIGAYAKPSGGIPKTDLASGVQGSLDLADSAIQARPSGEVDPTITPAEYATQEELAQLEAKVDEKSEVVDLLGTASGVSRTFNFAEYTHYEYFVNSSGKWTASTSPGTYSVIIPITPGTLKITAGETQSIFAFLSALPVVENNVSFGTVRGVAQSSRITLSAEASAIYQILPTDTSAYLVVRDDVSGVLKPTIEYEADVELNVPLNSEFAPVKNAVIKVYGGGDAVSLAGLPEYLGVLTSDLWAGTTSPSYKHIYLPVSPGESYKVTNPNASGAEIAPFTQQDLSPSIGDTPSFVANFGQIGIAANSSIYIRIPDTCNYLYITTLRGDTNRTPTVEKVYQEVLQTAVENKVGDEEIYYLKLLKPLGGVISSKVWAAAGSSAYCHIYQDVTPGEKYRIRNAGSNVVHFAPMKQRDLSFSNGDTPSYCNGYDNVIAVEVGASTEFTIPVDCTVLYLRTLYNYIEVKPELLKITEGNLENQIAELDEKILEQKEEQYKFNEYVLNGYLVGDNNTFVNRIFRGLKPGYKYRLLIKNPNWAKSSVTTPSVYLLQVASKYNGDTTYLVSVFTASPMPAIRDYYDFTVPDNSDYISVGLRANSGETVDFSLVYLQMAAEVSNSFNSQLHIGLTDWKTPCTRFSKLMQGDVQNNVPAVKKCEGFVFFTDPHLLFDSWNGHFEEYMGQLQKVYNSIPADFVLCGGDWLGNGDTPDVASFKLGMLSQTCYTMLAPCYLLVGNHDTNYQGKKDTESANYTTRMSIDALNNLWYYRNARKAYFDFQGRNTHFYCFDTQTEYTALTEYDNYGNKQAEWFATQLLSDNAEHIAVAFHIYWSDGNHSVNPIAEEIMRVAAAYDERGEITVNGNTFDFSAKTGRVEFALAGHIHSDADTAYDSEGANIPVIMTTDMGYGTSFPTDASFDLVFVDYDNREVKCIRVGSGSDRTISLD